MWSECPPKQLAHLLSVCQQDSLWCKWWSGSFKLRIPFHTSSPKRIGSNAWAPSLNVQMVIQVSTACSLFLFTLWPQSWQGWESDQALLMVQPDGLPMPGPWSCPSNLITAIAVHPHIELGVNNQVVMVSTATMRDQHLAVVVGTGMLALKIKWRSCFDCWRPIANTPKSRRLPLAVQTLVESCNQGRTVYDPCQSWCPPGSTPAVGSSVWSASWGFCSGYESVQSTFDSVWEKTSDIQTEEY